jgi:hypothetical protein
MLLSLKSCWISSLELQHFHLSNTDAPSSPPAALSATSLPHILSYRPILRSRLISWAYPGWGLKRDELLVAVILKGVGLGRAGQVKMRQEVAYGLRAAALTPTGVRGRGDSLLFGLCRAALRGAWMRAATA